MEEKYLLLKNNGKLKFTSSLSNLKNVKIVLIPLLKYDDTVFVPFEVSKHDEIFQFTDAKISISFNVEYQSGSGVYNIYEANDYVLEKSFTTLYDFVNYLFTLDEINMLNTLNTPYDNGFYIQMNIHQCIIDLYKDKKSLFSFKTSTNNVYIEIKDLLNDILTIYDHTINSFKKQKYLIIRDRRWLFANAYTLKDTIGIRLPMSNTISFIPASGMMMLNNIADIYAISTLITSDFTTIGINKIIHYVENSTESIQDYQLYEYDYCNANIITYYDKVYSNIQSIFELITFDKSISDLMLIEACFLDFLDSDVPKAVKHKYEITYKSGKINVLEIDNPHTISMDYLINEMNKF